ncbi:hypothetical protein [Solidesulfovibrio sp.]|uniref:hypothetical protein n=1 Tax=Solidesulfovibrio sp. TaxID=2910990 RepID=UPI00262D8780|nr:hypothetical protein [Solidesulfovibrio sp.]
MLTKMISELAAGAPTRTAEIPVNIGGLTVKLTVEQVLRLAAPADSGAAAAVHSLLSHAAAGLTNGHVLVATGPTTFEFRRLTEFHLPNPANIDVAGNAATASRLLNPRRIAGVEFDGTVGVAIPHGNLADAGGNSHAQLDAHVADAAKHREIDDAGTAATDLWSAARIIAQLADRAAVDHSHALADLSERAYVSLTERPAFFAVVAVAGQSSLVAEAEGDTLTLVPGVGIAITTDPETDAVTITNIGGGIPGAHGHTGPADGGTVAHGALTGVDADAGTGAIHHTLGTGANQAAPGNHGHAYLPLSGGALTGALTIAGGTAWHSGNDGPGSGLDADTVDGRHADELGSPALRIVMAQQFGAF